MGNSQSDDEENVPAVPVKTPVSSNIKTESAPKTTTPQPVLATLESQMTELLEEASDASSHNSIPEMKTSAEPPTPTVINSTTPNYSTANTQLSPELVEKAERAAQHAAERAAMTYLQEIQGYGIPNSNQSQIMEQTKQVAYVAYQQSLTHFQNQFLEEQHRIQMQIQMQQQAAQAARNSREIQQIPATTIITNPTTHRPNNEAQATKQVIQNQQQANESDKTEAANRAAAHRNSREVNVEPISDGVYNQAEAEKYPIPFKWKYGGRDVYVAHSGDGFRLKHHMDKVDAKLFEVTLELPPGKYFYKFIVDNAWRCDPDANKEKDPGTNKWFNVVEVGELTAVEENEKAETRGTYGQEVGDEQEYIRDPPMAPPQLGFILLNEQPKREDHPLTLPEPNHVTIDHLYVADTREEEVITLGLTERFKGKFITTVYYKPIDSRSNMTPNVDLDYSR